MLVPAYKFLSALLTAALLWIGGGEKVAQPSFEALYWAIATQESGGNYGAVGVWVRGDRAYGKYQVMGANIPSWTAKYYGRSLTPQQFLNNKQAQEAVARGVLQGYYNKYGFRGAASAWYSGNPDLHMSTRAQTGGPSIKGYVDSVWNHALKYTGKSSGATLSKTAEVQAEKEVRKSAEELAETYGFVDALFDSNPELKKLFKKAVKEQWTASKFQAELRDTKWWKTHSKSERDYLTTRFGDPATAKQEMKQAYTHVRQLANQLGVVESKSLLKRMNTWAYNMVAKGWNDAQLRNEIGKFVYFAEDKWQGEGGDTQRELREYAYSMGIQMSSKWYADRSRSVIRGMATIQDFKSEIRKQAKATYGHWSKQIDAGQTIMDLASPYMQSMATILELPSGSINPFNPTIKRALQAKDKNTGANIVVPLWQFENELRNDPRWRKTKNAQDSMMQVAHKVLTDFGVAY